MRSLSVCTAAVAVVANCEDNESNLGLYMHIPYCRLLRNSSCTQSLWQSSTMILDLQGDVHSWGDSTRRWRRQLVRTRPGSCALHWLRTCIRPDRLQDRLWRNLLRPVASHLCSSPHCRPPVSFDTFYSAPVAAALSACDLWPKENGSFRVLVGFFKCLSGCFGFRNNRKGL